MYKTSFWERERETCVRNPASSGKEGTYPPSPFPQDLELGKQPALGRRDSEAPKDRKAKGPAGDPGPPLGPEVCGVGSVLGEPVTGAEDPPGNMGDLGEQCLKAEWELRKL